MLDIKALKTALLQLEEEKKIPHDKVVDAVEKSLAAAYQKEYGKKGQVIRCQINFDTGEVFFEQVKSIVDETTVRMITEEEENIEIKEKIEAVSQEGEEVVELLPRFNEERHMLVKDAKLFKKNAALGDEIIFPLDSKDDFGRIAAQTAKQVIVQKLREAERESIVGEYKDKEGTIVTGIVQRVERGSVFLDIGRTTAIIPFEEQIATERLYAGERVSAYLFSIEEGFRGLSIRLSRTHPKFLIELFKRESAEIASGVVEIVSVSREPGSRSKIAVKANDARIDPVGACVGQRGSRVTAITQELSGEKIDVIEYKEDIKAYIFAALSPAKPLSIEINEEDKKAVVTVDPSEQSLAIGKGGQNVRLAAKLTGWKLDIISGGETYGEPLSKITEDTSEKSTDEIIDQEADAIVEAFGVEGVEEINTMGVEEVIRIQEEKQEGESEATAEALQ